MFYFDSRQRVRQQNRTETSASPQVKTNSTRTCYTVTGNLSTLGLPRVERYYSYKLYIYINI